MSITHSFVTDIHGAPTDVQCNRMKSLTIIYATSSGHTSYVIDTLVSVLSEKAKNCRVIRQRAEVTTIEDVHSAESILFACGTWNTGNTEGQLNPFMHQLLHETLKDCDLAEKPATAIGLGSDAYYFTARSADLLVEFITDHHGSVMLPPLKIINEPYGQESKIALWAEELIRTMKKLPSPLL